MKKILVLCTANICRSPMVAGLLSAKVAAAGLSAELTVTSAGVLAQDGQAVSRSSAEVMAERGVDIRQHLSASLQELMLRQADLIIVMEERHRQSILGYSPIYLRKVLLLSELAGEHHDLADPYGQSKQAYLITANEVERLLDKGWGTLLAKAGVKLAQS